MKAWQGDTSHTPETVQMTWIWKCRHRILVKNSDCYKNMKIGWNSTDHGGVWVCEDTEKEAGDLCIFAVIQSHQTYDGNIHQMMIIITLLNSENFQE